MEEPLDRCWPETWIARAGDVFLVIKAREDGGWSWEIMSQGWFHRTRTVAQGHVTGAFIEAQRTVEGEAEGRGLLSARTKEEKDRCK